MLYGLRRVFGIRQTPADLNDRLAHPRDPRAGRLPGKARVLELAARVSGAQSELQSPAAQRVERCRLAGQQRRVPETHLQNIGPQSQVLREHRRGHQPRERCRRPEMVGCRHAVKPQRLEALRMGDHRGSIDRNTRDPESVYRTAGHPILAGSQRRRERSVRRIRARGVSI